MTKFFLSFFLAGCLDLESTNLKVEFARDIIIPNIYVKLYLNPSINVGSRAMKMFF